MSYKSASNPRIIWFSQKKLASYIIYTYLYSRKPKKEHFSGSIIIKKLESLKPAVFIPQIEARIADLEEALKAKQFAVRKNPSGLVRIVRRGKTLLFYKRSSPSDAQGTYMPRSQEKLAHTLIQNDYDKKTIQAIEAEIKELKDFLKAYKEKCSDMAYKKLPSTRQEVVTPLTLDNEQYADTWLKVEYRHKKIPEDVPQLFTDNNEQVRSKSEVIIANALKAAEVPYRYEFPLLMDRNPADNYETADNMGSAHVTASAKARAKTPDFYDQDICQLHPDFYCLNLCTRQEFAWEHFGLMDDPDYAARATEKLELYAENGFFPGKNLIITMETSAKPLSSKLLKSVIQTYLK